MVYPTVGRFKFFEGPKGRPAGRAAVLIKITADCGTVGWGQSVPVPTWSYETLETAFSTITRYLAPELIGQDVFDTDAISAILRRTISPSFSTGQPIVVRAASADAVKAALAHPEVAAALVPPDHRDLLDLDLRELTYGP